MTEVVGMIGYAIDITERKRQEKERQKQEAALRESVLRFRGISEQAAIGIAFTGTVECYAGQLNQVFMNLLTNAIDALEERDKKRTPFDIKANPSTIQITTCVVAGGQKMAVSIADNGSGIPDSVKARIFDPFFTTKPIGKGTGLGLAISYQIVVEKHFGDLRCHSVRDRGTEFIMEIPIKQNSYRINT